MVTFGCVVLPPLDQLEHLLEIARVGSMRNVKKQVAMILQQDPAFLRHSKILPFCILAACDERLVYGRTALILHYLISIKPMFDAIIGIHNNTSGIPGTDGRGVAADFDRWDQIVK